MLGAVEAPAERGPTLPSVVAAEAVWTDQPGAIGSVAVSLLERAAIIGGALFLAGERKNLLRYTLATTIAIELVVLAVVKKQLDRGT